MPSAQINGQLALNTDVHSKGSPMSLAMLQIEPGKERPFDQLPAKPLKGTLAAKLGQALCTSLASKKQPSVNEFLRQRCSFPKQPDSPCLLFARHAAAAAAAGLLYLLALLPKQAMCAAWCEVKMSIRMHHLHGDSVGRSIEPIKQLISLSTQP